MKIGLILPGVTLAILGLLEGVLAILFFTPVRKYITYRPLSFLASRYYLGHRRSCQDMAYDKALTYTLKPNHLSRCSEIEYDVAVRTNSAGVRDTEEALQKPDIIALGDSFTFGQGVRHEETWPKVLERISGYKTLDAGISSYGTAREVELLKRFDQTNLKYVVIQYHWTDLMENEYYIEKGLKPVPTINQKQFLLWISMLDKDRYYPGRLIYDSAGLFRLYLKHDFKHTDETEKKDTDKHVDAFIRILNTVSVPQNVKLLIIGVDAPAWWKSSGATETMISENYGERGWKGFQAEYFLKQVEMLLPNPRHTSFVRNGRVVDTIPLLTDDAYFVIDDHINATGHARIAQAIRAALGSPQRAQSTQR